MNEKNMEAECTAPSAPMGEELPAPKYPQLNVLIEGMRSEQCGYTAEQVKSIVAPYAAHIRQLERELAERQTASVDTLEFRKLLHAMGAATGIPYHYNRLIAYIDGRATGTASDERVDDLAMLIRLLVRALSGASPDNRLIPRALDYLKRKGLAGSPLRAAPTPLNSGKEEAK
jgi:hypothetical protein